MQKRQSVSLGFYNRSEATKEYYRLHPMSEDHKEKISLARKNRYRLCPMSEETKKKISKALIEGNLERFVSEETKKKISKALMGRSVSDVIRKKRSKTMKEYRRLHPVSKETRKRLSLSHIGCKQSERTRRKLSVATSGSLNHNWKGGITSESFKIRRSIDMKLWREKVLQRDNFTCQKCEIRERFLCSHHIFSFNNRSDMRFVVSNGITFCEKCHGKFHSLYGFGNNDEFQLNKFLS